MRLLAARPLRLLLALTLVASFGLSVGSVEDTRAQGVGSGTRLVLVSQPVWYDADDTLRVRLRIENETPFTMDGFQIVAGVNARVQTRSDLHLSFEATPGFEQTRIPFSFDDRIPAFSKKTVSLDAPITDFPTLAAAVDGGVYPASFSLLDAAGVTILSSVSTPFILYPAKPEVPLGIVAVLPLNAVPARAPDGAFKAGQEGGFPLGEALRPGGWLSGWIAALEEATAVPPPPQRRRGNRGRRPPPDEGPAPLKISVAATGRLIEEIADLRDGYRMEDASEEDTRVRGSADRAIRRLGRLFDRSQVQAILAPYSFPDLPALVENLSPQHTQEQLLESRSVMGEALGVTLDGEWLFPPAGRLDQESLEALQLAGYASKTFFSKDTVEPPDDPLLAGCPEPTLSFTCPVSVETIHGTSRGFVADEGVNDQLALLQEEGGDRLALQRLFAETAQIHAELPGVAQRVIQMTIPSLWQPPPRLSRLFLRGLRGAPWLRTMTAEEGLETENSTKRTIVEEAPLILNTPDSTYYDSIEDAGELVDSFATAVSPTSDRLLRLRRNVLVAESRSWWRSTDEGLAFSRSVEEEVTEQLGQLSLGGVQDLTLTSREGQLQLVLLNEGLHPLRVQIRFITPNLILDDATIEDNFEPGSTPLNIEAIARTSGTFPVNVVVETVDGRYRIVEREIVVRSTSLNQIALGLTIGALLFLVLFYISRAVKRRRVPHHPPEEEVS